MGRVKGASPPALLDKSYKKQDTNNKQTLHYGMRAVIFKKNYQEMFNFES